MQSTRSLLADARGLVERKEMCTWRTRHVHKIANKKKGPVEPEKEEEEDKLERFFCHIHEFHNPVPKAPAFVPAELPPRYAINFVPAVNASVFATPVAPPVPAINASVFASPVVHSVPSVSASPVVPSISSTDYSIISSTNFVADSSSPSNCIGSN